jgi:hypothetical protein
MPAAARTPQKVPGEPFNSGHTAGAKDGLETVFAPQHRAETIGIRRASVHKKITGRGIHEVVLLMPRKVRGLCPYDARVASAVNVIGAIHHDLRL